MKTEQPKPTIRMLIDPDEISSVLRNGMGDIIGGKDERGQIWAYTWSLERWRKTHHEQGTIQ